ncbi:hypothetical protein NXY00_20185 [Bacteroides sp. BFG-551]|nr:hypothetical protein [Bacteroides sp. BFG-551]
MPNIHGRIAETVVVLNLMTELIRRKRQQVICANRREERDNMGPHQERHPDMESFIVSCQSDNYIKLPNGQPISGNPSIFRHDNFIG